MEPGKLNQLLELIGELVNGDGTWLEKKGSLIQEADETQKTNLAEFIAWFEEGLL